MTHAMMWCSRAACSVPALVGALCCFAAVSAAAQTSLILTGTPAPFEGGPDVTVTATLNNPAPANGTTVMLVPSGTATRGTNGDYTLSSTTIAIAARQMEGTATITITDDTDDDDGETIVLDATSRPEQRFAVKHPR